MCWENGGLGGGRKEKRGERKQKREKKREGRRGWKKWGGGRIFREKGRKDEVKEREKVYEKFNLLHSI